VVVTDVAGRLAADHSPDHNGHRQTASFSDLV